MRVLSIIFLLLINKIICNAQLTQEQDKFLLGNEVLLQNTEELKNKTAAIITNQTGILSNGTYLLDALLAKNINIAKIFSPEHGIRGDENYSNYDEKTGIPLVSLYGEKVKPSKSDLAGIDVLIYDIQDVGARFYTYTSTLYYAIEAAAENNTELIVCDRPIIVNPKYTDGFMLEEKYSSFVGKIPTPIAYGMSCGELAGYLNGEVFSRKCRLKIIKMTNYSRNTDFNALNLYWKKPSPSMFYPSTAVCYLATCLLEGTNISEGRGTEKPFEYLGAPWINSKKLADELNSLNLEGVRFEEAEFTPSEKISSYPPKFFNKKCNGVYINVSDKNKFKPVTAGIAILIALKNNSAEFKFTGNNFIDKLAGTDKLRKMILNGNSLEQIVSEYDDSLNNFNQIRSKYLLYN